MLTVFWDIPRVSGRADVRLGLHDLVDNVGRRHQERVSEKRNENKTKNAQGAVLMEGASRIWKFVKSNLLRGCMTWTCWAFFCGFALQVSSFVRSTAVCSATFRRDLLIQLLNP